MMTILTNPNPRLRETAKKITDFNDELNKLIEELTESMLVSDGIGIAAPQVGVSMRVIIVNTKQGPQCYINPEIVHASWRKESDEEGCLSVPGVFGLVKRSRNVVVRAQDQYGKQLEDIHARGLLARIFQHEIDHLNGVLFIDKMYRKTRDQSVVL